MARSCSSRIFFSFLWKLLFYSLLLFIAYFLFIYPISVFAQTEGIEIARTYVISGSDFQSGDIISFDRSSQQFRPASAPGDADLFGILVFEPVLVLTLDNGGVPIVRTGEVEVNITTINGAITAGDYITSSTIVGKGQKASEHAPYVIGVALESFPASTDAPSGADTVVGGSVRVLLSIGTKEQAAQILQQEEKPVDPGITEATLLNVIQYFIAAFIAIGAVYIAFKNFGPNIKDGIVSIGRNPLAKSSIQSMVILNSVLIILVSIGGLFIGLAILLLPI